MESTPSPDLKESSTSDKVESPEVVRRKPPNLKLWRPNSIVSLLSGARSPRAINSFASIENSSPEREQSDTPTPSPIVKRLPSSFIAKREWDTIVSVVIVEAKGLPAPPEGASHSAYCKISLGSTTVKTKAVATSRYIEWRERCKFRLNKDHSLRISIWDKGKMKNFMGSCVVDLMKLEKERTHEIWQELEDSFGAVHLSVTMCSVRDRSVSTEKEFNIDQIKKDFALFNIKPDSNVVGQLHVKVIAAKGLSGKPNAYCILEVDNERIQTPSARASSDPEWCKSYTFKVYDVTSSLDLKVYDNSIVKTDFLGKVTIPLLRIKDGEQCWYALKDRSRRHSAKGNCPRILLEMSLVYNPVTATLRLFQPKEVKHIKKPPKFDVILIHSNLEFIRDTFNALVQINECYKRLFEWENRELSAISLTAWLVFWGNFQLWMGPLLLLIPFLYFWLVSRNQDDSLIYKGGDNVEIEEKGAITIVNKIQELPDLTITITSGVEYTVSLAERLFNLVTFKVPFLSYLAIAFLVMASITIHFVPFNYLLMLLGVYKYTRKYINPERRLNNDLLDFISRIPDNEILKDWKELSVPEPHLRNLVNAKSSNKYLN